MDIATLQKKETSGLSREPVYDDRFNWFDHGSKSIFYVFDLDTNDVLFVSKSIENLSGYHREKYIREGLSFFASIIHPDDFGHILMKYVTVIRMIKENKENLIDEQHQLYNEFKIRHANGHWVWVEADAMILNFGNGEVRKIFGTMRNIDYKKGNSTTDSVNSADKVSKGEPNRINQITRPVPINLKKSPKEKVTPRELEVLQLVAHGYSAKQIADKLFISIHTAINHRKNLIEKFEVKNTAELILQASKVYWL